MVLEQLMTEQSPGMVKSDAEESKFSESRVFTMEQMMQSYIYKVIYL